MGTPSNSVADDGLHGDASNPSSAHSMMETLNYGSSKLSIPRTGGKQIVVVVPSPRAHIMELQGRIQLVQIGYSIEFTSNGIEELFCVGLQH